MWIFLKSGFASIVEHRDDSNLVVVRSRARIDLQRMVSEYFAGVGEIIATPEADYPFRIIASKAELREALARMADAVDYPNFKAAVTQADEPERCEIYEGVWSSLRRLETLNAAKRTHSS